MIGHEAFGVQGPASLSTSENQRRCLSYTVVISFPFTNSGAENVTSSSFTGAPTYTMNESHGALLPARLELMKLPSLVGVAPAPTPICALLIGSLSNQPARTPSIVFLSVDMLVLKLNEIVRPSPSASATSR